MAKFIKLTAFSSQEDYDKVPHWVNMSLVTEFWATAQTQYRKDPYTGELVKGIAPATILIFAAATQEDALSTYVTETPEEILSKMELGY